LLDQVEKADLVVADVTELSSAAYYALGMRHALGLPTVYIADTDHTIQVEPQDFLTLRYTLPQPGSDASGVGRFIDNLVDLIKRALADPTRISRRGRQAVELSPPERRRRLAERIDESVEAIKLLRINSLSSTVDDLTAIAAELRGASDEDTPSALRESAHKALKLLHSILDELATQPGARVIICGAAASILGGIGTTHAVAGFALALSAFFGKDAFGMALDKVLGNNPPKDK
jgi:hypothetical protein